MSSKKPSGIAYFQRLKKDLDVCTDIVLAPQDESIDLKIFRGTNGNLLKMLDHNKSKTLTVKQLIKILVHYSKPTTKINAGQMGINGVHICGDQVHLMSYSRLIKNK